MTNSVENILEPVQGQSTPAHFLLFLALMIAATPFALDAYLPALPVMAKDFAVDIVAMNNTISTFLMGNALGVVIAGPISDCKGRKPVGIAGLALFLVSSFVMVFATDVIQIQVLRFMQAIGSGMCTVICMPSIRDVYDVRETGSKLAIVMMIMGLAPLLAPVLGAVLLQINWQAIFITLGCYGVLLIVWYALGIRETRPGPTRKISTGKVIEQYLAVFNHRIDGRRVAIRYALSMSLMSGVLLTFLTNASFAYIQYFGVSEAVFPVFFGFSPIAMIAANYLSMHLIRRFDPQRIYRLANLAQLLLMTLLTLVVATGADSLLTVVPLIVCGVAMVGLINPAGSMLYMSHFRELSGSATSIITTGMYVLGAGFGWISGVLHDGTLLAMAVTMLSATLLANLVAWLTPDISLEHAQMHRP
ncbi:MAG: Bcr/CflA family efflux MFS transporter [Gammaproteobacteria bacterium]|nr:MAG: Bcr/CflA family efflux MFS transporter [Gammaproteobacteria bacterium]